MSRRILAAGSILIASLGAAHAQSSQSITINANVGASCTLGTFSQGTFTIVPNGGTVAPLNTPLQATAQVTCNQNANVKLTSSNTGLSNTTTSALGTGYVNKIHYNAQASYNGITEALNTTAGPTSAGTSTTAGAVTNGMLTLAVNPIATDSGNVLVAGSYTDTLTVALTPVP
jgi:hypothetical protein